ncbi:MAG: hypothetical protein ACR2QK_12915, partial [Acidimicrobiales bacterium]
MIDEVSGENLPLNPVADRTDSSPLAIVFGKHYPIFHDRQYDLLRAIWLLFHLVSFTVRPGANSSGGRTGRICCCQPHGIPW